MLSIISRNCISIVPPSCPSSPSSPTSIHPITILQLIDPIYKKNIMDPKPKHYVAVLIAELKNSSRQLYPLTKSFPMSMLPIGNKRLIVYQLQNLAKIPALQSIVVVLDESDEATQEYIEKTFLIYNRDYPKRITFYRAGSIENSFSSLQKVVSSLPPSRGVIVNLGDTLSSYDLSALVQFHETKQSDFTMLLKQKKENGDEVKKVPQGELENEIDHALISESGEVFFMEMASEFEHNGVKLHPSIYKRIKKAHFRKMVDSKIYIFSPNLRSIIEKIEAEQIDDIKPWFTQLIIANQTNTQLLQLVPGEQSAPLKIFAVVGEQDCYIRIINSKTVYEQLNFDSVIRGPKQKEILMPNKFSEPIDQKYSGNGCVAQSAVLGAGSKIRRSCIGPNCKIGKNVEIFSSIIMDGVEIQDNCKIFESIIGSRSEIGEGVSMRNCTCSINCKLIDGAKMQDQKIIFTY